VCMLCMWRGEVKGDRNSGDLLGGTLEKKYLSGTEESGRNREKLHTANFVII